MCDAEEAPRRWCLWGAIAGIGAGMGMDATATMIADGRRRERMRYVLAVLLGVLCSVSPPLRRSASASGFPA